MGITYQPIVIKKAEDIVSVFRETGFFYDYEIEDETFAFNYMCEKLTDKFIAGELNENVEDDEHLFTEDEMEKFLREIIAGSLLYELIERGIIDSIEDENNEERFFLTDLGKEISSEIQNGNLDNLNL
jgi:hypothetical protein